MGISGLNAQTTMKFALVVCFAALVACEPEAKPEAEADPALPYSTYGYGAYPYAYSGLYHGYAGYHAGYPYAYYGKRSADAEPKADPWVTYGAYGAYPYAYSGLHYGYAGYPYAYHYGKRSADAEPEADADAFYGYYGYARPYGYGYRYGGYRGYYWG